MKFVPYRDIVIKLSWRNPELSVLSQVARFDVAKLLRTGFPDGVMLVQKYVMDMEEIEEAWRSLHVEMVIDRDPDDPAAIPPDDEVWTISQEEIIKVRKRKKIQVEAGMIGDRPEYAILQLTFEPDQRFIDAVMTEIVKSMKRNNIKGIYDVGEIVQHLLNQVVNVPRRIADKDWHHYSWLEAKNKRVCSSFIATLIRQGLMAMNWYRLFIWPKIKENADITPGHYWFSKRLKRRMP